MGLFSRNDPLTRQLAALEEKRAAFILEAERFGFAPRRTLYVTRDGGFSGLADLDGCVALIYGPGPAEERDFSITFFDKNGLTASISEEYIAPTGMGGAFGFGTKPMGGFTISLMLPNGAVEKFTVMGNRDCCLETEGPRDRLFSEKPHKNGWNFAWEMNPVSPRDAAAIGNRWLELINSR